jgi:hypothetical protein
LASVRSRDERKKDAPYIVIRTLCFPTLKQLFSLIYWYYSKS